MQYDSLIHKKIFIVVSVFFLCIFAVGFDKNARTDGADHQTEIEREIIDTVDAQTKAVAKGDWDEFKRHLWENDETYIKERRRWFEDAVRTVDTGSFQMKVESVAPYKPGLLQVWVRQSYKEDGVYHSVRFPLNYQLTETGWKDADVTFRKMSRENVIAKYSDGQLSEQANVALNVAEKALEGFETRFGWEPDKPIQIKLYDRQELFRQSVKLSLPNWVAGWNERGQAIKFVGTTNWDGSDDTFASGIVHEITHRVMSDMSHDNAAYWLQEGVSEYYQRHLLPGLRIQAGEQLEKPIWTISELEQLNLETLPAAEARQYYLHSYDIIRYFMKRYGEEELVEWCEALKMYPVIDKESAAKISELNRRTREAFEKATHQSFKVFIQEWQSQYKNLK